jgi:hypothetical protein
MPSAMSHDRVERSGPEARTIVLISGAGLTVLAAGLGVGLAVQGASLNDDAETQRKQIAEQLGPGACANGGSGNRSCAKLDDTLERRNQANTYSQGAFIAAGVLGAATVATFFLWPKSSASVTPYATVGPTGDSAMLGVVGRY